MLVDFLGLTVEQLLGVLLLLGYLNSESVDLFVDLLSDLLLHVLSVLLLNIELKGDVILDELDLLCFSFV